MKQKESNAESFYGLGIAPGLLEQLEKLSYKTPTPIQHQAIPPALNGEDLIGIAQTGTGKTLAFTIPMLQRLSATKGVGLVLLPTRELALQVEEVVHKMGKMFGIRTAVLIGGTSMHPQIKDLRARPHVIIATPGRLIDHLKQRTLTLDKVNTLVLDEADRMLDMGFKPQIEKILASVPKDRQTLLFSATMPEQITKIARTHMKSPTRVEVAPAGTATELVEQEVYIVPKSDKLRLLEEVLGRYHGTVLVFSRTKHGAKKIARVVRQMGHSSAEIHSNRSLAQRKMALAGFKSGQYRVLIATDIAARGIDVKEIELIINFDLPDQAEDYVHRIGRTGRASHKGRAISFASPEQKRDLQSIERLIRSRLPILKLPVLPAAQKPLPDEPRERPERSYGRKPFGSSGDFGKRPRSTGGDRRPSFGGDRKAGAPTGPHRNGRPSRPRREF